MNRQTTMCNQALPPRRQAARPWNAGFIRQLGEPFVRLPDESGVSVVVSGCAPNHPIEGMASGFCRNGPDGGALPTEK
jgi:hypothetical protein